MSFSVDPGETVSAFHASICVLRGVTRNSCQAPIQRTALIGQSFGNQAGHFWQKIFKSLDQEAVRELWLTEAKRRRDEVRSGRVKPIPGAEAMESVRKIIDAK